MRAVMMSIGWLTQTVMKSNGLAIQNTLPSQFEPSSSTVFQSPIVPSCNTIPTEVEEIMTKLIAPSDANPMTTPIAYLPSPTPDLPTPTTDLPSPTAELPTPTTNLPTPTAELPTPIFDIPDPIGEIPENPAITAGTSDPAAEKYKPLVCPPNPTSLVRQLFSQSQVNSDLESSPSVLNCQKIAVPCYIPPVSYATMKLQCYCNMYDII